MTIPFDRDTSRVAVITGASSGIGEATARTLAAGGFRLALLARRAERIEALASELGHDAIAIEADVTDRDPRQCRRAGQGGAWGHRRPGEQRRHHAAGPVQRRPPR